MKEIARLLEQFEGRSSVRAAVGFVQGLVNRIGPGFHPDTPFGDYVRSDDDFSPAFSVAEAQKLDGELERAIDVLTDAGIDIAEVALPIQRQLLGR